jgi:predicted small metal-binding protein
VATTIACADLGNECQAVFTTDGADELMEHVALHAQRAHPDLELTPEVVETAKTVIRTT